MKMLVEKKIFVKSEAGESMDEIRKAVEKKHKVVVQKIANVDKAAFIASQARVFWTNTDTIFKPMQGTKWYQCICFEKIG